MKTNLILFALFLVLACDSALSQKNPTSKKPKQTPTGNGNATDRQGSCPEGKKLSFKKSNDLLANPERGYYHFREINSKSKPISPWEIKEWTKDGVTLVKMCFNLEKFVKKELTKKVLGEITDDFRTLRKGGMKAIVRFSYNYTTLEQPEKHNFPKTTDAKKPLLLKHIDQLRKIFEENVDVITVVQIGFIGHWGEWYYSRNYATQKGDSWEANSRQQKDRKEIVEALMKAVPKKRMLQIRYPSQKQIMYGSSNTKPDYDRATVRSRLGIHNDCFLAADQDMGTFKKDEEEKDRKWLEKEGLSVMVGGETCEKNDKTGCDEAKKQIEKQRFTYLNTEFHKKVIADWKKGKCYNFIGNRLGYRFELVGGNLQLTVKKGDSFCASLQIKNTGVAPLYNTRHFEIILKNAKHRSKPIRQTHIDPRTFAPGRVTTINFNVKVPSSLSQGKYDVVLNLPDEDPKLQDPKYRILFANGGKVQDKKERFNVIGEITVE